MPRYARADARTWIRQNLHGYITVLYTPFLPDGRIDEDGLRHNTELTLRHPGVGGLAVNSLHQEFWTMTVAERKRVADVVLDTVAGRKPVVVGCSDPAVANVVDFARHAQHAGADAVMVWPPYYGVRTADGVRTFYEQVAERIDIGMFCYSTTLAELGFYLTPEMAARLLHIEHLAAVMSTTLNMSSYAAMMERVGDRVSVTTSLEEYHLFGRLAFPDRAPDFMFGSSRPLFVQSQAQPHCADFLAALDAGDFAAAATAVRRIVAIADKLQSRYFAQGFHNVGLAKELTTLFGLKGGGVRPPLSPPAPAELQECVAILAEAGLLSDRSPVPSTLLEDPP
ncbi:MAG: dihydrodipicolinate synthase family protein [Burkholderiales bacterium]|nr:dihydrodipicolinate synthase family protein [Burkholderiales bacterium]